MKDLVAIVFVAGLIAYVRLKEIFLVTHIKVIY